MFNTARLALLSTLLLCFTRPAWNVEPPTPQRFLSPGKNWVVDASTRDLGGVQTVVTLRRTRQKVATFRDNILVVPGVHEISVQWEHDASAVTIFCKQCDVYNAEVALKEIDKIVVRYVTQ